MKTKKIIGVLFLALCQFMSVSQNLTCASATQIWLNCNDSIISNYSGSVGQVGPNYGCLATNPDPNWNYFKVKQAGTINVIISQVDNSLTATDVDYICWGPFASTNFCASLTSGTIISCSYNAAAVETMSFTASTGYYVLMTTNYAGSIGKTILHPNTGSAVVETMSISAVNPICMGSSAIISASGASTYSWTTGSTSSSITVSPASTTSYTVSGTKGMCSANISTVVTVNPLPVAVVNNNSPVCQGGTINLTSSSGAGYTYLWNGPNAFTSNSQNPTLVASSISLSGIYSLTITNAFGCTSSASTTVNVISNPTITVNSSTICLGNSATLTAAGATTYLWNTGPTSTSIVVSPTTTSSYSVTGTTAGCTGSSVATVIVNPVPTANASSNSPVCSGNPIFFTDLSSVSSGVITSRAWIGPNSYSSTLTNPSISNATVGMAGNYSLTVTTNNNCTNTFSFPVTVNPSPIITIATSSSVICNSNSATLTASGALSYTWNTANTTTAIAITPTVNTNYTVTGTNVFGCVGNATVAISVLSSKTISGTVTNTLSAAGGNMILYKYSSALSKWDSVAFTPFSSTYSFGNIDSSIYVIKAISTATDVQVTYGASSISWQGATIIPHGCNTNTIHNITIIPLTNIGAGTGSFSGIITQAQGFGHRMSSEFKPTAPGQPIGGIIVKGGRNPGAQMFAQTITAADGTYTLQGVPNSSSYDYFILVDIAGLDTNGTYHIPLTTGNQLTGLNFTVDSIYINPINNSVNVHDISPIENKIKVFPNPATNQITIQYNLLANSNVKIELCDILGKSVKTILPATEQSNNDYSYKVQLNDITAGMYFMKLKINNSESTIKLMITE